MDECYLRARVLERVFAAGGPVEVEAEGEVELDGEVEVADESLVVTLYGLQ